MTATVAATGSPVPPGPLDLLPAPLRDLAKADAAAAHDHTTHVAEDAFVAFLEESTTERAAAAEYAIATLRFEWEVLAAATQRLLADREDDRRIGRWLYDNLSTGSRISLGDVTEWPWLLAPVDPESQAPDSTPTDTKSQKQRHTHWRTRAAWVAQLGLSEGEAAPVEIIEEVANATLSLLDEVALATAENDRLRRQLRDRLTADSGFGPAAATHGPVAQERNSRLAVITAVPYRIRGDGSRYYDTEVARRLEATLREMTNSGNQLSVRTWTDIAGDGSGS